MEGLGIILDEIVGSTGLEIKSDPGVPLVYAGFGALMITTLISYISHSQVRSVGDHDIIDLDPCSHIVLI